MMACPEGEGFYRYPLKGKGFAQIFSCEGEGFFADSPPLMGGDQGEGDW